MFESQECGGLAIKWVHEVGIKGSIFERDCLVLAQALKKEKGFDVLLEIMLWI